MPSFENEPRDNTEIENIHIEEEHCTVELAGFKLNFIGTEKDRESHLLDAWNPSGRSVGIKDIPPVIYQKAKTAAEKAFGFQSPFEVTQEMLRDAKKYELVHEHGEEEVERMQREENRPASGPYKSASETEEKKILEDSEKGTQGELPLDKPE